MNLKKELKQYGKVEENADLKKYNTFRVGGKADYIVKPDNAHDVKDLIAFLKENNIPYFILGNGSNVILCSKDYHGVIIVFTEMSAIEVWPHIQTAIAEAGALMPKLAMESVDENLTGLEWAANLPGTVGGSVVGNAGCYNSSCADTLESITVLDENLEMKEIPASELAMGYRTSALKGNKDIIVLVAKFALANGNRKESLELIEDRKQRRLATQPLEYPSAGSVFRNPEDVPAGKLIEDCGLKGTKIGGAMVSEKHANFIINTGDATGEDIKALMNLVHDTVLKQKGYDLHPEQEFMEWE